ncbi:hypothetical protein ANO11243_020190 [Dothideomycetidae sp. 11243]|nr:hypothetical protein ANO11243_020190 [fungal sp. No.11243]
MSVREESARVSSAHGQDSSSRQLPGVHELFSAGLQNGSQHSGRLAPVSESQARTGQPTLPQVGSFKGPSHWQHSPAFPSLSAHATHVDSPPFAPSTAVSGAVQGRSPYAAPVPRLPPVVPRDFRGQGPFLDPAADDLRRDSARSNSTQSATTVTECIGQQHFPGRGLCYVYRDGATCPTVIDGEVVNPLWGTTKAGKARKRLAQACL